MVEQPGEKLSRWS